MTIHLKRLTLPSVTAKPVHSGDENSPGVHHIFPSSVAIISLLSVVAIFRVVATYATFSQTNDEPFHIAAGMEWLDRGTYTYELLHPPLARVAVALGPYLSGLRWPGSPLTEEDWLEEGTKILSAHGNYFHNLTLARLGTLPFLVLACVVVFLWADRWFGRVAAVFALLLLVCLPPLLGHAGIATTDVPVTATVAASLYVFLRWIERPDWLLTGLLGIAFGAAVASKYSAIGFLPVCVCAAAIYLGVVKRRLLFVRPLPWKRHVFRFVPAMLVALIFVWGTYHFSLRPISRPGSAHHHIDKYMSHSWMKRAAYRAVETPAPLLDLYDGLRAARTWQHDFRGYGYLFGQFHSTGCWYFFPVVILVKTPLGFLLLSGAGLATALCKNAANSWQQHLTVIFPFVILFICIASGINSGVRHILPIYPLLAVLGGYGASRLVTDGKRRWWMPTIGLVLVAWVAADSVAAHPDYLAYFNPLASAHPEMVLSDSDLDLGQDLYRLAARLRALGITQVAIKYFGTAPLELAGLPPYQELSPTTPTTGYIAISVHYSVLEHARNGSYGWLHRYQPVERVGRSIFLYRVP